MAADFSAWGSEEVFSKELENQARAKRLREQRWDKGLPVFMTAYGSSFNVLQRVVDLIDISGSTTKEAVWAVIVSQVKRGMPRAGNWQPHQEKLMDPEVSDGWTELVECELKVPAKFMENELMDYLTKLLAKLLLE